MKKNTFASFFIQLLIITAILFGAVYLASTNGIVNLTLEPLILIFAVLFGITSLSYLLIMRIAGSKPSSFTNSYMGASAARLFIYALFVGIYCHMHRDIMMPFLVLFFALYFVYTAFELRAVLTYMKGK